VRQYLGGGRLQGMRELPSKGSPASGKEGQFGLRQ